MIQVYTQPNCVQCEWTVRKLKEFEIPHRTNPLNDDIKAQVEARGLPMSAPVVVTPTDMWTGFKIDHLKALKTAAIRDSA